jgi:hypothetical protein
MKKFFVTLLVLAAVVAPAGAQYCQTYAGTFWDEDAADCASAPYNDRSFYMTGLEWKGEDFLIHSTGNDLELIRTSIPPEPYQGTGWHGSIGNQGDNDWGLEAFAVCDDCRFGVAYYRLGTVLFDLGEARSPRFASANILSSGLPYGFTFSHKGTQYLVSTGIGPAACPDGSGLYVFDTVDATQLAPIQCLSVNLTHGKYLQHPDRNGGKAFLWATAGGGRVSVWEVQDQGSDLQVAPVESGFNPIITGRANSLSSLAVDLENCAAVTVDRYSFRVWSVNDITDPVLVTTVGDHMENSLVTMSYPLVYTAGYQRPGSSMTWLIGDSVWQINPGFWGENPWNTHECQLREGGAAIIGDTLYVSRHAVAQAFDVSACFAARESLCEDQHLIFKEDFEDGSWNGTTE